MDISEIETQVLSLPLDQRAALANRLLDSLEELSESEFEEVWGRECAARVERAAARGEEPIPGDVVAKEARELLR